MNHPTYHRIEGTLAGLLWALEHVIDDDDKGGPWWNAIRRDFNNPNVQEWLEHWKSLKGSSVAAKDR